MTAAQPPSSLRYRVGVEGTEQQFTQHDGDTLLRAALREGVGIPYECNAGGCGSCRVQIAAGEVLDLWPEAPGLSDRDRRTGRMLACQTRAASDVTIRARTSSEHLGPHAPVRQRVGVAAIEPVTHDMRRFVLRSDSPARFLPGQFVSLFVPGVEAPRNYSMSNLENDDGLWELIVRRVPDGVASTFLFDELAVGDVVEIDGPYGLATLRPDAARDIACVAGGSGLAPMLSIARGAADLGLLGRHTLHFFYGARTPADVCGRHEVERLAAVGASVEFHPVVSVPAAEHAMAWDGLTGWVHAAACDVIARRAGRISDLEWYCAGPPPMTQALQSALILDHGVPVDQLHFDRFF